MSVVPSPIPNAVAQTRPLWLRFFKPCLKWALGSLCGVLALMLLVWVGLHAFILSHIDQWHSEIEAQASHVVGVSVRIGRIHVESQTWIPRIELHDVVLLNSQGQAALQLPRILAVLSLRSMVALELRFQYILIEGARLDIERDTHGKVLLAGIPMIQPGDTQNKTLNWLMQQGEVNLLKSSIHFIDHFRPASPFMLSDVNFVIRHKMRRYDLRLDATPPPEVGERFSVQGQLTQAPLKDPDDWQSWSGTLYAELPNTDVQGLKKHFSLPFALQEGFGAVRAWVILEKGTLHSLTLDLAIANLSAQLAQNLKPLWLKKIEGRLRFEPVGERHRLELQQFGFVTQNEVVWPRSDLSIRWLPGSGLAARGGDIRAQWLDFGLMAQMAPHFPLTSSLRHILSSRRPKGGVEGLSLAWHGPMENPDQYQIRGRFKNLSFQAIEAESKHTMGLPGLESVNMDLSATEKGGRADIQVHAGHIHWPGLFEEPRLPIQQLQSHLEWRMDRSLPHANPSVVMEIPKFKLTNQDGQLEAQAVWSNNPQSKAGEPDYGHLELRGKLLPGARADRVPRYLPRVLGPNLIGYLQSALQGGTLGEFGFKLKGHLKNFPFSAKPAGGAPNGEFQITGRVEDLTLNYIPDHPAQSQQPPIISPWPPLGKVAADLIFEHDHFYIRDATAQYENVQLSNIDAHIQHLGHDSRLMINGMGRGPLSDMLNFVKHSPVARWTQSALSEASGSGLAELKLALSIPLEKLTESTLKGSIVLQGNDIQPNRELPVLRSTRGSIEFTQKSFKLLGLRSYLAGGETQVDGGWQPDTGLRIVAQGHVSAEGLRKIPEWPGVAQAAQWLSGQTHYHLNFGLLQGRPEMTLTSDGMGLGIHLPAPFRRSADAPQPWPIQLQITPHPDDGAHQNSRRDTIRLIFGTALRAIYQRDGNGSEAPRVQGQVWLSDSSTETAIPSALKGPGPGVVADIVLQSLHLDEWQELIRSTASPKGPSGLASHTSSYLPSNILLKANELMLGSHRIEKLSAQVTHEGELWRATLDAPKISGKLEYRPARQGSKDQIMARLERLHLPPPEASGSDSMWQENALEHLPALDIAINNFQLGKKNFGRLEIEASAGDSTPVWKISRLNLTAPEATLKAQGQWAATDSSGRSSRRMALDFKLEIKNGGLLIERFGGERLIRGGKGDIFGQIQWVGSPFDVDYQIMAGQMKVAIESGQFLKVEPGAARLLGVLSLQSLPRRLILDFRDIFQEGFAFDNITGDITLFNSIASTTNLRMRGLQAVVLMEGNADLRHETQDLRVFVVPEINAGTASLAYAVINPGIGLGTFVAQLFLRKPLAQASTREFHISGSWGDPQVERIERKIETQAPPSSTIENSPGSSSASPMPITPDGTP